MRSTLAVRKCIYSRVALGYCPGIPKRNYFRHSRNASPAIVETEIASKEEEEEAGASKLVGNKAYAGGRIIIFVRDRPRGVNFLTSVNFEPANCSIKS